MDMTYAPAARSCYSQAYGDSIGGWVTILIIMLHTKNYKDFNFSPFSFSSLRLLLSSLPWC